MMRKIVAIVGNRPQFIKLAPVEAALRARGAAPHMIHTGQHHDANMSEVFFRELGIPAPQENLGISGGSHGAMTARMLAALEERLIALAPDAVLLFGDTNSTLAAALAAVKLRLPAAHVEAGPRLHDIHNPEELNRRVADLVSGLCFCPDRVSVENLRREGRTDGVHFTGDVMYDSFRRFVAPARERAAGLLARLGVAPGRFALWTVHRAENTDDPAALREVVSALKAAPLPAVFPMHPRTRQALERAGLLAEVEACAQVRAIPAAGYLDALALLDSCAKVVTDSGGLQKEAFFSGKPAIVLFPETPWPAIRDDGWSTLAVDAAGKVTGAAIVEALVRFEPRGPRGDHFGDGRAAEKIAELMLLTIRPPSGVIAGLPS